MCDESITIRLSLFLTTQPSTIEQIWYLIQFHIFTQRYFIQCINSIDVLSHYCPQLHQLKSNLWDHCIKRVIWRCESFADIGKFELWQTECASKILADGKSLISLNRWFVRVAIRNWSHLALTFPSSLGAIQHIRFGNIILRKLSSWQPHIRGICKRFLINIKVLGNNIIVFVTFVLSTNICLQYLRFRLNATLSMILCGAIFIIG